VHAPSAKIGVAEPEAAPGATKRSAQQKGGGGSRKGTGNKESFKMLTPQTRAGASGSKKNGWKRRDKREYGMGNGSMRFGGKKLDLQKFAH